MQIPVTTFDKPQWRLLPDSRGPRMYGNVDNQMEVAGSRVSFQVAVAVPTELFSFLREVANVSADDRVSLSLDDIDGSFVFSVLVSRAGGAKHLFDLWSYPKGSVPRWIMSREYRL